MSEVFHLLQFEALPIWQQLHIEEALLRADTRNWCLINHGAPPAIVMGISGKPDELVHAEKIASSPIPLIRRFSGGGTVVIDENTCFITFICNTSFIPIEPFPQHIMRWTEQIYRPLFQRLPFALKENDYVIGERKCGGNAQSICKQRWLHHSSLLWDFDPARMDYLLHPPKAPAYRNRRSHEEFLCCLKAYWPKKREMLDTFIYFLGKQFNLKAVQEQEIDEVLQRPHRKATTWI